MHLNFNVALLNFKLMYFAKCLYITPYKPHIEAMGLIHANEYKVFPKAAQASVFRLSVSSTRSTVSAF